MTYKEPEWMKLFTPYMNKNGLKIVEHMVNDVTLQNEVRLSDGWFWYQFTINEKDPISTQIDFAFLEYSYRRECALCKDGTKEHTCESECPKLKNLC